jgi:hippurate hydrolase
MPPRTFAVCILLAALAPAQTDADRAWLDAQLDPLVALYEHFHRNPELSFREVQTAKRLAQELRDVGVDVTERVGGHGMVGMIRNGEGPLVMVRADMDALPIAEQTGLAYASKIRGEAADGRPVGIMHACGHDVHMTCLVGVARFFGAHRDRWRGTLMLVGQPAEERVGGARAMLKDGLFEKFGKPGCGIALHVSSDLPTGVVGYRAGYALANVDSVDITVFGRGGHGSAPHTTIDPIVQAARLVLDLQTVVAREIDPIEPAVITVGSIHGGSKHNIIDDTCHLQLTVRSYSDAVREKLKAAIVRKARATAQSAGASEPKIEFSEASPALFNDGDLVARCVQAFQRALGSDSVREVPQVMGAEDFSMFGRSGVPVFMFRLGTIAPERLEKMQAGEMGALSLHSPFYYPDARDSVRVGVLAMIAALLDLLPA